MYHEGGEDDDPAPAAVGRRWQVPRRILCRSRGRERRSIGILWSGGGGFVLPHIAARLRGHHEDRSLKLVCVVLLSRVLVELLRRWKRPRELGVVPPAGRVG